jgi:replicative DNA helicase
LYVIAARPSKGKTALVIRMLLGLARAGEPCALFTLEMPDIQIAHRIFASEAKIELSDLRTGKLPEGGWSRLASALNDIGKLPLWIDDGAALTMPELRGRVRRFNAKRDIEKQPKLSVVAVDYLQLMTVPRVEGGRWTNREQQVADNSRGLKRLAKDDNLAVIALAQLNREIEKRGGEKRPQLSDIRESGSVEQDADTVAFVHRPDSKDGGDSGQAEIIVAKQRNGPTTSIDLAFIAKYAHFENLARDENYEWDGTDSRFPD